MKEHFIPYFSKLLLVNLMHTGQNITNTILKNIQKGQSVKIGFVTPFGHCTPSSDRKIHLRVMRHKSKMYVTISGADEGGLVKVLSKLCNVTL